MQVAGYSVAKKSMTTEVVAEIRGVEGRSSFKLNTQPSTTGTGALRVHNLRATALLDASVTPDSANLTNLGCWRYWTLTSCTSALLSLW
ncbi:hypothetical protein D3C80_877060 [compost metagenome]